MVLDLVDRVRCAAAGADRAGRSASRRRCSPRTPTRSRRSRRRSRTTCWRSSSSSSATSRDCVPRSRRRIAIRSGRARSPGPAFPIDRQRTTELLGFDAPTGNTYGSIATVDYLLESVGRCCGAARRSRPRGPGPAALVHARSSATCGLPDDFVQCSSIMPQKRNPVALEHARAIGSKALGQATADSAGGPQHALRRHRRHRRRSAAARGSDVHGRVARRGARRGRDGARRASTSRSSRSAPRRAGSP